MLRTGTAGWSLPSKPNDPGSRLYHYSRSLGCVEVNSSFYRPHRASTWARWATETPPDFRFSIKAPKAITHEAKLCHTETLLKDFFEQIRPMGEKGGPILFQLPPSLAFDSGIAEDFLGLLRMVYEKEVVMELRHASWFAPPVDALLKKYLIARVASDPPKGAAQAGEPGGSTRLAYFRLHGTPHTYYSNYDDPFLATFAAAIRKLSNAWVIFDNTALSHAYPNALRLQKLIAEWG
jgi:uncharacterized protein YecE (DUF72 family)